MQHTILRGPAWSRAWTVSACLAFTAPAWAASGPVVSEDAYQQSLRKTCDSRPDIPWEEMNALEKHVAFFDLDADGRITVQETYRGLRDLGISPVLSAPFAAAINGALATPTAGYPTLTIQVDTIEAGIHGSDSGIYDDDGHFVPEVFHQWFKKWDADGDGALNLVELTRRWYAETDLFDFFGAIASGGEFSVLFLVAQENGKISEARMRGLYDGSLFYAIAGDLGTLGCREPWLGE
ncbi:caleosin family protein [Oligoflexus tunisiensis]|uniref:caleosin family protein n=1 Tax=Oligoflexus tunisiensis TaxID=708132 RepID=UPI00114CF9E7|nr:caleosin family protein [Oligoflexus tunisiensis]